ncbi:MAG: hypothetical protein SV422_09780 [Pseudomonadota bacterium]|nr:hypothetical protein [Pseudomonadota bacterium]
MKRRYKVFAAVIALSSFQSYGLYAQTPADSEGLLALKTLAGSWSGPTYKHKDERVWAQEDNAVVTYKLTGGGSAVVETLFPGTPSEMTTVYHDDSQGRLVMTHYCNARNQPKLELVSFENNQLTFELAADADIDAEHEHHAHGLTITIGDDGSLQHDWTNHNMGEAADLRNIRLSRVQQ